MARTSAARALTRVAAPRAARFHVSVATPADDGDVRRLLRERALAGDVSISLEREPDSGIAAAIEGDIHQTIVARESSSGRIAAIASRGVRNAFVNGRPVRLGYLGQLRIAASFRASRSLLNAGFACCRALHEAGDTPIYLSSIVEDNHAARRLLIGLRSELIPRFIHVGTLVTLMMRRARRGAASIASGVEIRHGSIELLGEIAQCLWRNARRYQFAPCWTTDDLFSAQRTPGLTPDDFLVAMHRGRVVGCVACWDQRPFKQAIVRGYSPRLARWRPLLNVGAVLIGAPRLPAPGDRLEFAYLSHLAVDDDRPDVTNALLMRARSEMPGDVDYVAIGLAKDSPLLAVAERLPHRAYRSTLYLAFWPDGERAASAIDGRFPHPEVAIL